MKYTLSFLLFLPYLAFAQHSAADIPTYGLENNMPLFYQEAKKALTYPLAWENVTHVTFDNWRPEARNILLECLDNLPPTTSFEPVITATEKREGYEARKIAFNLSAWYRVPGYLLVPEGEGPFPALVVLHDHGAKFSIGKEKMVRPFGVDPAVLEEAEEWSIRCYDGLFTGDFFAQNGYVVLAIDALFWGERGRKEGVDYDGQQALAANLMQMGMSWGGVITFDDIQSAAFLETLPEVDPDRIGAVGFSMGAHRAWMLSAASDKVKAAAAISWMNTTDSLMTLTNNQNKGGSAYSMILPGIRKYMDYPHVAAIACPKPALFFNGLYDKLFPVEGVEAAYRSMRKVWESQGAGDKLVTKLWEQPHFFNREMHLESLEFFNRWLGKP